MKSVRDTDVRDKKVFLRVDFNVPMKNGVIEDINRIKAAIPTIQYLLDNKAKIIIGTHLGRPDGQFNAEFSTVPVAAELSKLLNQKVEATDHVLSPIVTVKIDQMKAGDIFMLGNLRFHKEEEENNEAFARELARYAEVYVNDAFAVSHRANASVEAITNFLPSFAGLLLESEITSFDLLLKNPEHPFDLVIGGAKVKDKAGLLFYLADKADNVLIGGAVGNTFLKARGEEMSKSLIDEEMVGKCQEILEKFGQKIKLPVDFEKEMLSETDFNAKDIGPKTREEYARILGEAKCIFWNGNMGYTEDEKFTQGTQAIAQAMVDNHNTTVIAGGDTVGYVSIKNMKEGISFISTGGGAAMEYLSGEKLPGLEALDRNSQ